MEIKNVIDARNTASNYFKEKGIIILPKEILSIFKRRSAWFLEIENEKFKGIIIIRSSNGEILNTIEI